MKKIFLTSFVLILATTLHAQVQFDYLRGADNYFNKGDYYSAAEYYEKYLGIPASGKSEQGYAPYVAQGSKAKSSKGSSTSREQAIYNLAESYRHLHYHVKAEPFYQEAASFDKAQFPHAGFWYATTLRALEKYAEAEAAFKDFLAGYTANDKFKSDAEREIENLQFIQKQLAKDNLSMYKLAKPTGDLPDSGAVYAPVLHNNTFYFTSTKALDGVHKLQVHNNRLYQADYAAGNISNVNKTNLPELKDVHQGVVSISADGNSMYLTRWSIVKGQKQASIYRSNFEAGTWSDPVALSAEVNQPGSNNQQAFIMPDGKKLIFSSDRAGGEGSYDLWSADIDAAGNASNVKNLGSTVNTINDEQAPFYHTASGQLVFSSNGRVGMGGLDFYHTKMVNGAWSTPVNFGYPVNSVKDDVYFTSNGNASNILENVLFSSDRDAACCLEMFTLQKANPLKQISGIVKDCVTGAPISGATVSVKNSSNATVQNLTTNAGGEYAFTMAEFETLKLEANANGYYGNSLSTNTPEDETVIVMKNDEICLQPIVIDKPIVVNNVYYDFNSAALRPESHEELDKLVEFFAANPDIVVELSAHTDSKGSDSYNEKLSDARAKSVVDYLVSKGVDKAKLISKGYGESQPVAPNVNPDGSDNPEGRQQNRRTEFKVLKN